MAGIRAGMTAGARWPTRFRGGNDGFLATIAWELSHPRNESAFRSTFGSSALVYVLNNAKKYAREAGIPPWAPLRE